IQALKKLGIWEEVEKEAVRVDGDMTHIPGKKTILDPIEENGEAVLYTIHRTALNNVLLQQLEKLPNVRVNFNTRLISIDKWNKIMYLQNTETKEVFSSSAECIVGADGINSVVRSEMQRGIDTSNVQEHFN